MKEKHLNLTVKRTHLGLETEDAGTLVVPAMDERAGIATVGFGMAKTINLGNYQSARVEVRIDCPCYKAEIQEVYEQVRDLVIYYIEEETERIKQEA
jgi:hypothetical protein